MSVPMTDTDETSSLTERLHKRWFSMAFRHTKAEKLMYIMFVSGLLLWEPLQLIWQVNRWVLLMHMVVGATVFTVIVGAFWSSHRRLVAKAKKPFLRYTGQAIEWLLLACSISGFYLLFFGVTGDDQSVLIQNVHFYSSWLLAPLVFRHAFRWSVLNVKQRFQRRKKSA
ncbi:hypothetical protein [Litoribacillus peritrichatus]|uniref:Transmembrane protein n=1 Tax=Litoribacillus peritrichatus TaxID=718191 RepID=A0ABP7MHC4_9GAMM